MTEIPTAAAAPASRPAALAFIYVTMLLEVLALGLVIPVQPKLVESFLGGDTSRAVAIYGLMGMSWAAMQLVFSPILGALSDRFGRRPVILFSILGAGLDYILMALAPSLVWLFAGRIVSGIAAATFSTSAAYVADITPPERRAAAFGMIGAVSGLGFVLGPALGGIFGAIDPRLPFWIAAGLALTNATYGYLVLPESLAPANRARFRVTAANPVGALAIYRSHPELMALGGVIALYHLAHAVLPSVAVLFMSYRFGWTTREIGFLLAGVGISSAIVQGILVGPFVKRFGPRVALVVGLIAGTVGFIGQGAFSDPRLFCLAIPVFALWGFIGPAVFQLMSARIAPDAQGALQGANAVLIGLGNLVGPILFSQSFAAAILPGAAFPYPGAPMFIAAGLLAVALAVTLTAQEARPAKRS